MSSIVDAGADDRVLRTLLEDTLGLPGTLNTNIHPDDQMVGFVAAARGGEAVARSEYFIIGAQLLKILEQLVRWKFGALENLPAFLDFASGYGRLTRFLVHKLPPDRIWISDIQPDAVAFQQAEFGVHGLVSTVDPNDLVCDRTFDCIFVASLFSHLPRATFAPWLKKLYSLLKPGGLLAFSVHGENRLPADATIPDTGIWFGAESEIDSLDKSQYGTAVVTESFVSDAIVAATGHPIYHRIQYGLLFHQDLYLVVNEAAPDFSGLRFDYLPHGTVDFGYWTAPGELFLHGWAADVAAAGSPVEVQLYSNSQLRNTCVTGICRPDVQAHIRDDRFLYSGWECSCRLPDGDSAGTIVVKAISPAGTESLLYAGTIAPLLPRGNVDVCRWAGPGRLYVTGWAPDVTGTGEPVEVQVFVGDRLRQKCLTSVYRPDVREQFRDEQFSYSGWECYCRLPDDDPAQVLDVKAICHDGTESVLFLGTVSALLSQVWEAAVTAAESREEQREPLRQMQADLDRRLEYIRHLEAEIARKNTALANLENARRRRPWQRRSLP